MLVYRPQGTGYGESKLLAELNAGQAHSIENFRGSGTPLTVTVNSITTGIPRRANVSVLFGTTPPPTRAPTPFPSPLPTPTPTRAPTPLPTPGPPTKAPTPSPTSAPTPAPTPFPTPAPTTSAPTLKVTKYLCSQKSQSLLKICAEGTTAVCNSSNCNKGRKQCWVNENCPQGQCSLNGLNCGSGSDCCSGFCSSVGLCEQEPPPPPSQCALSGESCQFTACCAGLTCPRGKPSLRKCY